MLALIMNLFYYEFYESNLLYFLQLRDTVGKNDLIKEIVTDRYNGETANRITRAVDTMQAEVRMRAYQCQWTELSRLLEINLIIVFVTRMCTPTHTHTDRTNMIA